MTKIGSARIGENGRATGGNPGDQTGGEVSTQAYYNHTGGWYVLRARDAGTAKKLALAMRKACANANIGYNQISRLTLYKEVEDKGFDPGQAGRCNTDCSALVRVCLAYAGVKTPDFNTESERAVILATGKFSDVTDRVNLSTGGGLYEGDILVTRRKGHTVIVTDGSTRTAGGKTAKKKSSSKANARVHEFQKAYNNYFKPQIEADGIIGPATTAAMKKAVIKPGDYSKPQLTKIIQKAVGVTADGKFGPKTKNYVMEYQSKKKLSIDGIVGYRTWTAILKG